MPRPKSLGPYAPLSATYYRDDAILEAAEKAELLYVRGLAYCAETPTDGFISQRQLELVVGIGLRDLRKRAEALISVGLWEAVDGGYVIRSWLKWNKSADEIGRFLKKDRERKAGGKPPPAAPQAERIPDGIQADSGHHITTHHSTTQHVTSRDGIARNPVAQLPLPADDPTEPKFEDFYDVYPLDQDRAEAARAWHEALDAGANPRAIYDAAIRHRDDPNRDDEFTKHPANWLRKKSWTNGPLPARRGRVASQPKSEQSHAALDAMKDPEPPTVFRAVSGGI